jgi:signal transduction histidine kinase/CheY-like chemotaxis protein
MDGNRKDMDHSGSQLPPQQVWDSLQAISRSLEELKQRLGTLEQSVHGGAPTAEPGPGGARVEVGEILSADQWEALGPLHEVNAIPSSGLEPSQVFDLAIDRVSRLLGADRVLLYLLDSEQHRLDPKAARGFRRSDLTELSLPLGEGIVGRVFREGRPVIFHTQPGIRAADPLIVKFPVREAIAVPIRSDGETAGVLFAGRLQIAPFRIEEIQVLILVADRVGTAILHVRLLERITHQVNRLKELVELSARISGRLDLDQVLSATSEAAVRLLQMRLATIALLDHEGGLWIRSSYGFPNEQMIQSRLPEHVGVTGIMLESGQAVSVPDLFMSSEIRDPFFQNLNVRGLLALPLKVRDQIVGGLYLADTSPKSFSADEHETATLLATQVSIAIENARLYGELRQAYEELKSTQEQLVQSEKVRALGEMAGGIAHDFNNILAIILGKTQLMLERIADQPIREDLGVIEEAAWRAAETVRRLQVFATTRGEEALLAVDLNSLVMDAIGITRPRWKDESEARGIRVEVVTNLEEIPPVLGHPVDLREMLVNLILNALDAMPQGGRLTFTTRRLDGDVELTVSDTGVGMSEEIRRRIFDPFFTTRSPQRAGLGLSVVHGIVARHRGDIEVESREGHGATFRLTLPATQRGADRPVTPSPPPETERASILVIEDEAPLRKTLSDILLAANHSVQVASDGLEGLAMFQRGVFDLVFTDLSMPELSGLEVARAVKKMAPKVPVILVSGWGDQLDPARIRESGVDLMIAKPFRVERVMSTLGDALALRKLLSK